QSGLVADKDYTVAAGTVTLLSNSSGNYGFDLPVGKWKILYYKDNHVVQAKNVEIIENFYLNQDIYLIPVFGSINGYVIDKDSGEKLGDVLVGFRNQSNYQYTKTDSNG